MPTSQTAPYSDTTTESSTFLSAPAAVSVAATGSASAPNPAAPNLTPRGHINYRVRSMLLPDDPRFSTRPRRVITP